MFFFSHSISGAQLSGNSIKDIRKQDSVGGSIVQLRLPCILSQLFASRELGQQNHLPQLKQGGRGNVMTLVILISTFLLNGKLENEPEKFVFILLYFTTRLVKTIAENLALDTQNTFKNSKRGLFRHALQ